jgi:hypothetical protein
MYTALLECVTLGQDGMRFALFLIKAVQSGTKSGTKFQVRGACSEIYAQGTRRSCAWLSTETCLTNQDSLFSMSR